MGGPAWCLGLRLALGLGVALVLAAVLLFTFFCCSADSRSAEEFERFTWRSPGLAWGGRGSAGFCSSGSGASAPAPCAAKDWALEMFLSMGTRTSGAAGKLLLCLISLAGGSVTIELVSWLGSGLFLFESWLSPALECSACSLSTHCSVSETETLGLSLELDLGSSEG